jgi:hypothetical protein
MEMLWNKEQECRVLIAWNEVGCEFYEAESAKAKKNDLYIEAEDGEKFFTKEKVVGVK